jgi:uncharacterized circularly permuted ATP-grasp superfamily protein
MLLAPSNVEKTQWLLFSTPGPLNETYFEHHLSSLGHLSKREMI